MDIAVKTGKTYLPKYLVYFQLIYICFVQLLIGAGLPGSLTLLCDGVNVLLFICLIWHSGKTISVLSRFKAYYIIVALFFMTGIFSAVFNGINIVLLLWSVRNFGRFVVFFTAVITFFDMGDFKAMRKIVYVIGHISFVLCVFQFVVLKLKGDYIGGVFGTNRGVANTWLNTFLVVLYLLALTEWMYKGKGFARLLIFIAEVLFVAVVGELKFFFVELILITIICIILIKPTLKLVKMELAIIAIGIAAFAISIPILYKMFPFFADFFQAKNFFKIASESYTGQGDLGRTTAVFEIAEKIFFKDPFKVLFGIGLGNGEYSEGQRIFQSAFYLKYKDTNYNWFTDAFVMVETGFTGVVLFASGFIATGIRSFRIYYHERRNNMVLITLVLSFTALMLYIYNISLNCEIAYLLYAFLGMGLTGTERSVRITNKTDSKVDYE